MNYEFVVTTTRSFDFMTFDFRHVFFNRKERKGFTQSSQRNKVFLFCQSEFISDSVFIEMLKQVQHDNIMSGLIRVNL
jgi:hypothetical protein